MRIFIAFWCVFAVLAWSFHAFAENEASYKGKLNLIYHGTPKSFSNIPTFEEFPAEKFVSNKVAKDIDWSSNKDAWHYRTRLRAGLKKGVNFNGHYVIATHGCGSSCQVHWVIDVYSGKVLGNFGTTTSLEYRLESSLIIADGIPEGADWAEEYGMISSIDYFSVKNDELIKVKTLDLSTMWTSKQ